jgi:hypothetical protein
VESTLSGNKLLPDQASLTLCHVKTGNPNWMINAAAGPIRERDYEALRCYAGSAPVTKQSGKRRMVSMRRACSDRVRQAVFHWSGRSIMVDSRSRQHYDRLRAAGHGHARALRGVGDRLLAVLTAILQSGKLYDASLRGTFTCKIGKH